MDGLTIFERERLLKVARSANLRTKRPITSKITPADRGAEGPLSYSQQRLWFLAQMEGVSEAYHIPLGLRLHGRLDGEALRRALQRIVARHEGLRTIFKLIDGEPVQRILAVEESGFQLVEHDLERHSKGKHHMNSTWRPSSDR